MISKKLFEKITGIYVDPTIKFKPKLKNNILKLSVVSEFYTEKDVGEEIDQDEYNEMIEKYGVVWSVCEKQSFNIYELIHKCKVFAESEGFGTKVTYFNNVCSTVVLFDIKWSPPKKEEFIFEDEDEIEAMFKACEYILETRNTNL